MCRFWIGVAIAAGLAVIGCTEEQQRSIGSSSSAVSSEASAPEKVIDAGASSGDVEELATPVSHVVTAPVTPPSKQSAAERLQQKLDYLGAAKARVVRASVDSITVEERDVPAELRWGKSPTIVSRMTLTSIEALCGAEAASLTANFLGGTLDGKTKQDSKLSARIQEGEEYVLLLRQEAGELWVQTRYDRLRVDGDTLYLSGDSITKNEVANLCP